MTCVHYIKRTRCTQLAVVRLLHPDGSPNPGGFYCQAHADAILKEYRVKLHEQWNTIPLRDDLFVSHVPGD